MTALQLRQKRAKIAADAALLIPKTGSISPEDKRKFDLMMFECESLKSEIDAAERSGAGGEDERSRLERLERELRETRRPQEAPLDGFDEAVDSAATRRYARAFSSYLRNGLNPTERGGRGVSDEDRAVLISRRGSERRDMGVATGSDGGYFVPTGFVYNVESAMKWYGSMLQSSTIMDTASGQPLPWPTDNDTTIVGEQIDENKPGDDGRTSRSARSRSTPGNIRRDSLRSRSNCSRTARLISMTTSRRSSGCVSAAF